MLRYFSFFLFFIFLTMEIIMIRRMLMVYRCRTLMMVKAMKQATKGTGKTYHCI